MMFSDLGKILVDILKLSPRWFFAATLVAAALLFSPRPWLSSIGVDGIASSQRQFIGLLFICSLAICSVALSVKAINFIKYRLYVRSRERRTREKLSSLMEDEKQILRYYFVYQTRSNVLRFDDGVVKGLEAAGVIYRASEVGNILEGFAYNISNVAWKYIEQNPELLEGATRSCRTDKRDISRF